MFFKKKCYNCGAKNPEGLKACAMCGAPFALRQMNEQLEGRKRPAPAWPKEVGKEVEEEKAEEEAEITCPKCGTVFFVSHEEDAVICPNPECRAVPQTTRRYEERREFLNLIHPMQPWFIRLQVPSAEVSEQEIEMKEKTGFLDRLRERFRDHTRDNICAGLHTLGVDAKMDMRRRAEEENIGIGSLGTGSLGVIDIPEGPIRWVNVRRESMNYGEYGSSTTYYTDYGVPDPRLEPVWPQPIIKSDREHGWKGKDYGLGIIDRLNEDTFINEVVKNRKVEISAHGYYMCWIIITLGGDPPSGELWSCYQAIARHLLAEWSPG